VDAAGPVAFPFHSIIFGVFYFSSGNPSIRSSKPPPLDTPCFPVPFFGAMYRCTSLLHFFLLAEFSPDPKNILGNLYFAYKLVFFPKIKKIKSP
jgi:hypothetical protein